ncbi:hypothetical protein HMN09_00047000 [Mycena chlorophos]|uniref:Uncharacterized protein n=1 Tax=Mycena chlorophos TaxID=658473 RepID=A0A8H6WMC7_MYCCL|nr:hypothetical protein HMN09_00047000 [Mycena chlorophos]
MDSDSIQLTLRSMKTSFALGTLLGLPLYTAYALRTNRRALLSVRRLLNASTASGLGAAGAAGAVEVSRISVSDEATLKTRYMKAATSLSLRRQDDFGTIGAVLGSCLVPAIFWTRAGIFDLIAGGLSLGYGAGFTVHHVQTLLGDKAGTAAVPIDRPQ